MSKNRPTEFVPTYPDPKPVPKPAPPERVGPPTPEQVAAAVEALRVILRAQRWDDQGGYFDFHGGTFRHEGSIGHATADQMMTLFAFSGLTPDQIGTRGDCSDCVNAIDGRERGYARPCVDCTRPWHSNFVAASTLTKDS